MLPVYNTILLIDDDRIQNHLNKLVITRYLHPHSTEIIAFTNPATGFDYIKEIECHKRERTLLLIDINMPELSGWELLDKIAELEEPAREHLTIFMLSSSIDPADKLRAQANPLVKKCISKPLSDHLKEIFGDCFS